MLIRLDNPRPFFRPLKRMIVEPGTRDDWRLLHELHYKAEGLPAASRYWRCSLDGETIGVLVTSSPKLLLKERHRAFPNLKPGRDTHTSNVARAKWVNANMRVVSRFVIDTMYRGIGIAYRFQNLASRMEGVRYMEIQSSMSKYNLFAHKAGFRFVKPSNANKFEIGMRFFRSTFASNPADYEAIIAEIEAQPTLLRERTIAETRAFYFQHSALEKTGSRGKSNAKNDRMADMPLRELMKNLQQMVLAAPLYGVYQNPDWGRDIPKRLPLLTFDEQGPSQPLQRA